jgi:Zn-dependent M16 (insulinase) family peptidase
LVSRGGLICNVTLDAENWRTFEPRLATFVASLPATSAEQAPWTPTPPPSFEGLTIPARVNYVAKGTNLYQHDYDLDGSVAVIVNYLRTTWLWERVRVQGGAYGGFCTFDRYSGLFSYLSYRDPNLLDTVETYDRTAQFLRDLDLDQDELTKSIIGVIGNIDTYRLPDAKGYASMARYLSSESDEQRQRYRDQVLDTTADDFAAFVDVLQSVSDHGRVVVMGSQQAIEAANEKRGGWLEVTKVL